jgi:4'-phosphopantetheinyl transferase
VTPEVDPNRSRQSEPDRIRVRYLTQVLENLPAGSYDWLAPQERARVASLKVPKRQSDWLLGRWTAKLAVCQALSLGQGPEVLSRIEIRAAPDGAPEAFRDGDRCDLVISISHSGGRAVCAVAPGGTALGCDLERVRPLRKATIETFFAAEERERLLAAASRRRVVLPILIWSAKESALKALREGLRLDTRAVIVDPDLAEHQGGWFRLSVRHLGSGQQFRGWWREENGWVLTVVSRPEPRMPLEANADPR